MFSRGEKYMLMGIISNLLTIRCVFYHLCLYYISCSSVVNGSFIYLVGLCMSYGIFKVYVLNYRVISLFVISVALSLTRISGSPNFAIHCS